MEYNESHISLDFHEVFDMERPKVIISFVRSKVVFCLTWLYQKEQKKNEEKKKLFYIYINNYK